MRWLPLLLLSLSLQAWGSGAWPAPGSAPWADNWYGLLADLGLADSPFPSKDEARRAAEQFVQLQASLRGTSATEAQAKLDDTHTSGALSRWVKEHTPDYDAFRRLRAALHHERHLANLPRPEFPQISGLSLGQSHPELVKLRRLLAARLGDTLPPHLIDRDVWDPPLIEAIKRFQTRSQLPRSGTLTPDTIDALNMDSAQRIAAIRFSLRQWLQLPARLTGDTILVNLPHFELLALEGQQIRLVLPVIVGAADTPTPRFNSRFSSITLNPTWTPPMSIVREELLPAYRRDPLTLKRRGFELIDPANPKGPGKPWSSVAPGELPSLLSSYRLRQKPGSNNALGKARLNLVNSRAIFLHDTPNKKLFRRSQRALSHGCIRIDEIDRLLSHLAKNIPPQKVKQMQLAQIRGNTLTQRLAISPQVYIVYMPAWPQGEYGATIAPDIYSLI